ARGPTSSGRWVPGKVSLSKPRPRRSNWQEGQKLFDGPVEAPQCGQVSEAVIDAPPALVPSPWVFEAAPAHSGAPGFGPTIWIIQYVGSRRHRAPSKEPPLTTAEPV